MKIFATAVIILALTVSLVILNSVFLDNIEKELLAAIAEMPEENSAIADPAKSNKIDEKNTRLLKTWNKYKNYISLVALYDYVYDIQFAIDQLQEFYNSGLYAEYTVQKKLLTSAVERLGEAEEFSLTAIF